MRFACRFSAAEFRSRSSTDSNQRKVDDRVSVETCASEDETILDGRIRPFFSNEVGRIRLKRWGTFVPGVFMVRAGSKASSGHGKDAPESSLKFRQV